MYTVGEMIQDLQSYDSRLAVDELLRDPAFINRISQTVDSLPAQSRNKIRDAFRGSKQPSACRHNSVPSQEALRAICRTTNVALPDSLTAVYAEWRRQPHSFWTSHGFRIESGDLSHMYREMKQLETKRKSDTVIWRYFTVFFYDLMQLIGGGRTYLVQKLQNKLMEAIDSPGMLPDAPQHIQGNLKRWASAGLRYHNITTRLGDGALILLPQQVTDNIWENRLPMKGPCFDAAMTHLLGLGISDAAKSIGADMLGSEVRKMILQPFQQQSLNEPVNCETSTSPPGLNFSILPGQITESSSEVGEYKIALQDPMRRDTTPWELARKYHPA